MGFLSSFLPCCSSSVKRNLSASDIPAGSSSKDIVVNEPAETSTTPAPTEKKTKPVRLSRSLLAARIVLNDPFAQPTPTKPSKKSKVEPYTPAAALALFKQYSLDPDDPDSIDPEGMEKLCADGDIPMEGTLPLILAWQVDGKELAKFDKTGWEKGMAKLKYAPVPNSKSQY